MDWGGAVRTDELHVVLSHSVMIRRLKSQVLQELPSKRRQKIEIDADMRSLRELQQVLRDVEGTEVAQLLTKSASSQDLEAEDKAEHKLRQNIMVAYRLTGLAKVRGSCDFMDTLLENGIKFILFAHHVEVLNGLEEHLRKRKAGHIRIDGSVAPGKRHESVQRFQRDEACRVALLSLTATSQGISLTASSTVVFCEMNWTPGVMDQAEDRVHRIGQNNAVNIYYLYAEHTLDSVLIRMIKSKNVVVAHALDGQSVRYQLEAASQSSAINNHRHKQAPAEVPSQSESQRPESPSEEQQSESPPVKSATAPRPMPKADKSLESDVSRELESIPAAEESPATASLGPGALPPSTNPGSGLNLIRGKQENEHMEYKEDVKMPKTVAKSSEECTPSSYRKRSSPFDLDSSLDEGDSTPTPTPPPPRPTGLLIHGKKPAKKHFHITPVPRPKNHKTPPRKKVRESP